MVGVAIATSCSDPPAQTPTCATTTCAATATCSDATGEAVCTCNTGYTGDGLTCADVNECGVTSDCSVNAICANTPGGFSCACERGYDGDGKTCIVVPRDIVANDYRSCVVFGNGRTHCWGFNNYGVLGLGDLASRGDDPNEMGTRLPAIALGTGRTVAQLAAGERHSCALLDNNTVKCWGNGLNGPVGQGDTTIRGDAPNEMGDALPTVNVGTGRTVKALAAGYYHTCALLDDATVKCWGFNSLGQVASGDNADRGDEPNEMGDALPTVNFGTGRTATSIAAGGNTNCAILDNDTVKCWGGNRDGMLGLGDTENRGDATGEMGDGLPALDLGTGRTVKMLAVGGLAQCALLDNGAVKCWGSNAFGQLGLGDKLARGDERGEMGDALPAVNLGVARTAKAIYAGVIHNCAILDDDTVKCWGLNDSGQLGTGDTTTRGDDQGEMGDALLPIDLGTGRTARSLMVGSYHTCALLDNFQIKCWGNNFVGQLGLGDKIDRGSAPGQMGNALLAVELPTP